MPECAKTHLQQSRISKFSGEDSRTSRGGKGKGGEGREGTGEGGMGGMGGWGGALDMGSPPPRDTLWIRPLVSRTTTVPSFKV